MSETTLDAQARQDDDLAVLLANASTPDPNRATWALLTLLVLTVGFVGGALAYRAYGPAFERRATSPPQWRPACRGCRGRPTTRRRPASPRSRRRA